MGKPLDVVTSEIRALTGLRGIAAWIVVVYHFRDDAIAGGAINFPDFLRYGYLAVDLFFILSGLVIYINYRKSFAVFEVRGVLDFYLKRIARIYPLHIFILVLFIINPIAIVMFSSQGIVGERYDLNYFLMSVFLVQNWGFSEGLAWNVPAWSISTELAAYLLFPFIAYGIEILAKLWTRLPIFGLVVLPISLMVFFHSIGMSSLGNSISDVGIVRCIVEFAMGMCLGYLFLEATGRVSTLSFWSGIAIPFYVAFCWLFEINRDYYVAPLFFCLVIVFLLDPERLLSRLLASRLVYFLGTISYSTYLSHYFVKDWVKFLSDSIGLLEFCIYLLVVFLLSMVLYTNVEQRFRRVTYSWLVNRFDLRKSNA